MNDAYRTLLTYISNNDLTRARDVAKVILRGSKTAKDAEFCNKLLNKMDAQDEKGLEIPYNLKSIIQTSCNAYGFIHDRYYLTEREREALDHIIRMYRTGARLASIGIHYPNTTLLYGGSGTGKTTFAQYAAHELGLPFLYISLTQVIDSLLGKTGQNMELVFNFISSVPCVAVMDEIDAIGTKRKEDGGVSGELKRVLISVMENLDRLPNSVVLIAATNRPETLDEALMRRFRLKHEVTPLSPEESKAMVSMYMERLGLRTLGNIDSFLGTLVSERERGLPFEDTHTPAAILDCLNERIAKAFSESSEERPVVKLYDGAGLKQDNFLIVDDAGNNVNNDLFTPEYADKIMATLRKFGDTSLNKISDVLPGGLPVDAIKSLSIGIPEEYRWNPIKSGSSSRTCSPIERLLEPYTLKEFPCPRCDKKNLRLMQQEGTMGEPEYWVGCGSCGWDCKADICHDCGEVIADFKTWYAAWIMLDRPKDRLEEDLVNEFGQPEDD